MKKYALTVAFSMSIIKSEIPRIVHSEGAVIRECSAFQPSTPLSNFEINAAHEDYDKMCDELPSKPMSRWQIMLARVGTPVLTTYIAIKRYITRQFYKWHSIVIRTKKVVKK